MLLKGMADRLRRRTVGRNDLPKTMAVGLIAAIAASAAISAVLKAVLGAAL